MKTFAGHDVELPLKRGGERVLVLFLLNWPFSCIFQLFHISFAAAVNPNKKQVTCFYFAHNLLGNKWDAISFWVRTAPCRQTSMLQSSVSTFSMPETRLVFLQTGNTVWILTSSPHYLSFTIVYHYDWILPREYHALSAIYLISLEVKSFAVCGFYSVLGLNVIWKFVYLYFLGCLRALPREVIR